MCARVELCASMRERESSAAKGRPKTLCPGEDGHPGGWVARTIPMCASRRSFPVCVSVLRVSVRSSTYDALLDTGYWTKVIVCKVNGSSGREYEIFIYDFDRWTNRASNSVVHFRYVNNYQRLYAKYKGLKIVHKKKKLYIHF